MDMQELGYFLYMEECEKEKVNVDQNNDLVGDQTTTNRDQETNIKKSWKIPPILWKIMSQLLQSHRLRKPSYISWYKIKAI